MKPKPRNIMTNSMTTSARRADSRHSSLISAKDLLTGIGLAASAIVAISAAFVWISPLAFFTAVGTGLLCLPTPSNPN